MAPIWKELAEKLDSKKIVVAAMDSTANDLPSDAGFRIEGFPTLKLFKAETNEVVDYEGDRTLEGMLAFLKAKAVYGSEITESSESSESTEDSGNDEEHDEL